MQKAKSLLAGGAVIAFLIAGLPTTGEAAWWKFGSRSDKGGQSELQPPGDVGGMAATNVAQSQDADRLSRIEAQIRALTGQIEELTHDLQQLQDQMKRAQEDNEFRFQDLESGKSGGRKAAAAPPPPAAEQNAQAEAAPAVVDQPAAEAPAGDQIGNLAEAPPADAGGDGQALGAPPRPLGTLTLDGPPPAGDGPIDLSSMARGGDNAQAGDATVAALAPSGNPRADYEAAYGNILRGDYSLAEAGFRQFLATYPGDALSPDAQYWLGESYFARGKYREAANEFLSGYKSYPKSAKGPDILFKLGASLAGLGERDAACQTYAKVLKQYPQISNAMRQRVKTEQASASC
jgi:tol-pal system protein YbgF